jgi:lipopolysaccharide export system protein LptA
VRKPIGPDRRNALLAAAAIAAAFAMADATAIAQAPKGRAQSPPASQPTTSMQAPNNALQGFQTNRGKPIKIAANQLEVRDKDKQATFSGDVHVIQGDTDLRCKVLTVYYEEDSDPSAPKEPKPAGAQQGGGQQQIRRMEAKGSVVVTQKDQTATGDNADYDVHTDTVTLTGNVVVTQGQNVLRGQKLVVNTTTGISRMEMPTGGRVEGLFTSSPPKTESPGSPPRPAPRTN